MSNPFDQFDTPMPRKGVPAAPQGGSGNPFDQFDAPKAAPAQKVAQGPSEAQQSGGWKQTGGDLLRTYLDTLTFGLGDRALGLYTGQDEAANTEAAKSRLGLWGLVPEAAAFLTPGGDLGLGAKLAGKVAGAAAPYVGRWAAGALGSAASGAAITGAQDIGHGQAPTAGDLLLGAGVGGAAGALGGFGRGAKAAQPAITDAATIGRTAVKPAADAAKNITYASQPVLDDLNNVTSGLSASQSTLSSEPQGLIKDMTAKLKPQAPPAQMTAQQYQQFLATGGMRPDVTADDLDSWMRQFGEMKNTGGASNDYVQAIQNHLANATPTSGHAVGAGLDASNAIRAAGAQKGFAQTLEDMAQDPGSAPGKAKKELYDNSQFYQDPSTGQINNYGQALQGVAGTAEHAPSTWLIRRVGLPIAEHVVGAGMGGLMGYEAGGKESGIESAILGSMLGGVAPQVAHAYLEKNIAAKQLRALQAARATATAGAPSIGGPLVQPEAFLPQAWRRNLLRQGALGALAANAPGSQPGQ